MQVTSLTRKIKLEEELSPSFSTEIASTLGNDTLNHCIQCGTCSATCPLSIYMDYTPRRIIALVRNGFKQEALECFTIWLCASCYACTVDCPKEIKITNVMYTLKRRAIDEEIYPKRFTIPVLAREFFSLVLKNGRSSEGRLLLRMYLKTQPWRMFKNSRMGMKLWSRGRIGLGSESIKQKEQLHALMAAVDERVAANGQREEFTV